jgi:pilus assembly protein Flp/PilA
MDKLKGFANRLIKNDDGATAIEYGLLAALIAVFIIAAVTSLGQGVFQTFDSAAVGMGQEATPMPGGEGEEE